MTISKRQFTQLQAMGIELWQLKSSANEKNTHSIQYLDIKLPSLLETTIFTDILNSLNLSIGEVSCENNSLSLGLLTWQFSQQTEISLEHQHLVTPALDILKNSPQLKQALWQKLQEHSIT